MYEREERFLLEKVQSGPLNLPATALTCNLWHSAFVAVATTDVKIRKRLCSCPRQYSFVRLFPSVAVLYYGSHPWNFAVRLMEMIHVTRPHSEQPALLWICNDSVILKKIEEKKSPTFK